MLINVLEDALASEPEHESISAAKQKLVKVITHINTKRFFGRIDLTPLLKTAQTTHEIANTATESPQERLRSGLAKWVAEGPENEQRQKASERIWACFLHKARGLDLMNCRLSSLPPEIDELTSLQTLVLDENKLTGLPPELGKLTSLSILGLIKNPISKLPHELRSMNPSPKVHIDANKKYLLG